MKVLLFTHEQDIDGMGSIIIGKQAFQEFDYITCKSFEINQKVEETITNGSIYNYDFIYVTDICIKEPLLARISSDERLKHKILILDHHKSEIDEGNNKYPFVTIEISNEKGGTSGTSLFYEYLKSIGLLQSNPCLDKLVELTRQYDTWEWLTIYNNNKARMLHILFEQLGYQKYIDSVNDVVSSKQNFKFSDEHLNLIYEFERKQRANEKSRDPYVKYLENLSRNQYNLIKSAARLHRTTVIGLEKSYVLEEYRKNHGLRLSPEDEKLFDISTYIPCDDSFWNDMHQASNNSSNEAEFNKRLAADYCTTEEMISDKIAELGAHQPFQLIKHFNPQD